MRKIQVLGFDCAACRKTYTRIAKLTKQHGIAASVEKIDDPHVLLAYRVMAPPGVVIDGRLVHSGGLPSQRQIETWLLE